MATHSKTDRHYVVAFDICSSTAMLDQLTKSDRMHLWALMLRALHDHLVLGRNLFRLELHKFTGDGWLLFFPETMEGDAVFDFLGGLARHHLRLHQGTIEPALLKPPTIVGLTFGMDAGALARVKMDGRMEYVGWPLNMACRLQGAIKDFDKTPNGRVLMTRELYEKKKGTLERFQPSVVFRRLRGIQNDKLIACVKLALDVAIDPKFKCDENLVAATNS